MNVTLKHLRAFLAVAERANFRRAAEHLHVSQPGLSAIIQDLEAEVGLALFDRTTRRVEITAAGREFLPNAAKLVGDLDAALRGLNDIAVRSRGHVAVACPPLLASVMVPHIVAAYLRRHPGIRVTILDARTDQIVDKVRSGEADLGVGTFDADAAGIERRTVTTDTMMAFAEKSSPLAAKRRIAWQDLAAEPLIALTRESSIRRLVEQGFAAQGAPVRPAFEVAQVTTAIALVEAGLGVAVLPAIAWAFARHRNVAAVSLHAPRIDRDVSTIQAAGRSLTPAAAGFADLLRERAADVLPVGAVARHMA